jgi:hypothetical protein
MFWPIRALAQDIGFAVHGVPATLTKPHPDDDVVISATAVWVQPLDEQDPFGQQLKRREPRKVLALKRDAVGTEVPRGTVIVAPERTGDAARTWRVEGLDRVEVDLVRVIVTPQASDT